MRTIVEINQLVKRYPGNQELALKDISLTIREGDVIGLVGENGAGKTTLIRLLLGLLRPTAGQILLQTGQKLGYVPERPAFYETLTVLEYLNLAARATGLRSKQRLKQTEEALEMVKLKDKAHSRIATLSKGMLHRLGIAQAIIGKPDFLIMDEPASGLDPIGQKEIRDIILALKSQGGTILFSSHYLTEIERVCTRLVVLHRGALVMDRSMTELALDSRQRVEMEIDVAAGVMAKTFSQLGLIFTWEGRRLLFSQLDDANYFMVMKLLAEQRIRVLEMRYPGVLLEDLLLSVTGGGKGNMR